MNIQKLLILSCFLSIYFSCATAQGTANKTIPTVENVAIGDGDIRATIDKMSDKIESKVIEWRRHIHQNPELSNREFKTGEMVAKHLESLGIEVTRNVAKTGVKGVLKGGKPGPVVALRADMDLSLIHI